MSDTLPTPVWDEPPSKRGGAGVAIDWKPTLRFLAQKPGEWARVSGPHPLHDTNGRKVASAAGTRSASLRKFGEGRIETRVRTVEEDGKQVQYLWARLKATRS